MYETRAKGKNMTLSEKDSFSSKWGFILAAAGSAIGMGNIWLFPYRIGELGGSAFLIPYIICVSLLGFTAIIGEITIGRYMGIGPIGTFRKALELRGKNGNLGEAFGWFSVIVIFIIALGYTVIVAWVIRFLAGSLTGAAFSASDSALYFSSVTGANIIIWIAFTLVIASVSMVRGVEKGIEKISKFMLPAFGVLFLVIAVRVAFLPGSFEGYKYLFMPRWEFLFVPRTWILALGQAFYSLSIFGSIMIVYGSYAKKSDNIISSAKNIVILDTVSAIIASLVIIPAVFSFGTDVSRGPSLMFETMPDIFKTIPFGQFFMAIFFIAVFFAALTSFISILEVVIETLQNKFKLRRAPAVVLTAAAAFACNIFIKGNIGGFMDVLEIYFVPICALTGGIFAFWIFPKKLFKQEIETGANKPLGKLLLPMGRYVLCGLIIFIYIMNILHMNQ
jgi:NSS family neurotransmitter:Na+ symporter